MQSANKIWLITFIALALVVVLAEVRMFISSDKNFAGSELINRGVGWKKNESRYSGSEATTLIKGADKVSFGFETNSLADQSVEITIDKDKYTISSPNINDQLLTIKITKDKIHTINIKHICTHAKFECEIKLTKLFLHGGIILPYNPTKKILTVLGDSISTLYGAKNYTFLLTRDLGYELHNASILGSTISKTSAGDNLINRFEKDLKGFDSDKIIIFSGTNDISHNVTLEKFESNYDLIVNKIKNLSPNSKIFLVGILPRSDLKGSLVNDYNEIISDIASKNGASYIDTSGILSSSDFLDAIHPLVESQQKISDSINKAITLAK